MREEALIGVNQQILGRNRNLYFVVAEHRHSFQKWLHIEEGRLRLGNMGETAIVIDESQQLGSSFVDGFQALLQVFILCNPGKQSFAQRSNRCDGIHDFMGQHTNQLDPRIHLLIAQLVAHVAQGDDAHVLVFQHGLRLMLCQVFILQLSFYLIHVGKHICIEQPEGCLVVLQDVVVAIHHQDARIYRIQILHKSLNRIKLFLQHTREEQMDREKYYEQILNAVDTGILVVDSHDNILQHNQAALRLLDTDVLTHMNQVKGKLKDEHLAKHETQAMLKDKHVRIIALSDVSHELSNQEVDSWIKLIRVLTHEIMNTITPVTSLSETLLKELGSREQLLADNESDDLHSPDNFSVELLSAEQAKLKQGLETIHKTGTELLAFVNNYRRFTHVPQPQPALFYVEPFLERMALLCNHEVEISVSPKDLLVYADESLLSHVVTNLLKNAVEAFKEKEREDKQECRSADLQSAASKKTFIRLQAYANAQESIIIDVSNNAGLIPEDVASHIFIPFFTTKPEGSGIGLSLSRQIMRVSGGSLSLHQDKAQGITTFRIIIP